MPSSYFPVHSHSEYSWLDGMGTVQDMVARVAKLDQPGLALTDHGVMSGSIRLYKECRKNDIAPFPGSEFYLVKDLSDPDKSTRTERFHLGMLALDQTGYRALTALSSLSHKRERFHRKPLIDLADLADLSEHASGHVALTTGCYFGLVIQTLIKMGRESAKMVVKMYATWFPGTTFVELQNHHVNHDSDVTDEWIVSELHAIAQELGLPVVAGQDSHYCEQGHKIAHDMMKDICYMGGEGEDNRFPGGSYHLASAGWLRKRFSGEWDDVESGHDLLLDLNKLRLPELDTYKFHVPKLYGSPMGELKRQVDTGYGRRIGVVFDTYERRLKRELDVIGKMGMENYFLLVKDVTDWCRSEGVIVNARGSANGSLVCYVLGITNVDPLEWNTDFDRFLSLDRQKPPDIDLDVESSKRQQLIEYIRSKFPSMVQLGTYLKLGINTQEDEFGEGEDKGSVFVQYMAAKRRKVKDFDGRVAPEDREPLNLLDDLAVRKAPGCHAAGLILPGEGLAISDYLATMLIPSSNTTVTQAPMDDVEDAGYVKLDILGLRTLETINLTLDLIGKKRGDLDWIPWDDKKAMTLLRSRKTDGVFQFEGFTTMNGARQMKVQTTMDAIFCLALFRPAMMNSGMTERYLDNRTNGVTDKIHPVIDRVLDDTNGVPVFQEQVIAMMRAVDLPYDDLNAIIKAVKASNDKITAAEQVFTRVKPQYLRLCQDKGMDADEAVKAWKVISDFTDYGFNRAHATSYGQMAYRSAYLKAHHPVAFMAALLSVWAGTNKEPQYIAEARRLGLDIVRPDVNASDVRWTVDPTRPKALRKGLTSIKGIGLGAAEAIVHERQENGDYQSIEDMIDRLPARPVTGGKSWQAKSTLNGVYLTLRGAGALRSVGLQRERM